MNTRNAGCTNTNCCHVDLIIIAVSSTSCKNPVCAYTELAHAAFYANNSCVKGVAERSGTYLTKNGQLAYRAKCVTCCVKLGAKMIDALFSEGYGTDSVKK